MEKKYIRILSVFFLFYIGASAQLKFDRIDSLFAYAERNGSTAKIADQQVLLAKWTKVAAIANGVNFRNPLSFSATDNFLLPVNFIPADAFGGPAGSYRQITLGQQYVSNFNFNPQIDIINPSNLAKIKSASINKELTSVGNALAKKSLYESIAAAWSNVLIMQQQVSITKEMSLYADSIVGIIRSKYEEGIAREQDLNNGNVNSLLLKDKLQQLQASLLQQLNSIKTLCDIPANVVLEIKGTSWNFVPESIKPTGELQSRYQLLQSELASSELSSARYSMLPVLSLVYYQGWQKNSNVGFTDANASWIQSKYIGLRITVPFPPEVNKLSQSYTNKINYRISALNASHTRLQNELSNESLMLDYDKSLSSLSLSLEIEKLKQSNYQKSVEQYRAGILPADLLITAFTDLLTSRLNSASADGVYQYNKNRIYINNNIK